MPMLMEGLKYINYKNTQKQKKVEKHNLQEAKLHKYC